MHLVLVRFAVGPFMVWFFRAVTPRAYIIPVTDRDQNM